VLHGRVHIIIVGCGRVGAGLGVGLTEQGHSVSVIDRNPKSFERLPPGWPGLTVTGSGCDRDDLDRAGAGRASSLAAVTSGDNSNILTARIARETYEIPNVVARIYDPRRAEIFQRLGIPTVPSVSWTIDQVFRRILPSSGSFVWTDGSGRLHLAERALPVAWAGRRIVDLLPSAGVRLAAVTRATIPTMDVADLVGQEGDVLHLLVADEASAGLEARFTSAEQAVRS
jgi:trk system potassium uptake protein TrkA